MRFFLAALFFIPFNLLAQLQQSDCDSLRNGLFYYYSKTDDNHFAYMRQGNLQKEIHRETGDTVVWEVKWKNCEYSLAYVAGSRIYDEVAKKSPEKLRTQVQIVHVTPDYYVYQSSTRANKNATPARDTLWRIEQTAKLEKKNIVEASFPGGNEAWRTYLSKTFYEHEKELGKAKEGTCYVTFVVDTDGSVSSAEAITMEKSVIAKIAVNAIMNGPKWIPATRDGVPVKALKTQPVTFEFKKE